MSRAIRHPANSRILFRLINLRRTSAQSPTRWCRVCGPTCAVKEIPLKWRTSGTGRVLRSRPIARRWRFPTRYGSSKGRRFCKEFRSASTAKCKPLGSRGPAGGERGAHNRRWCGSLTFNTGKWPAGVELGRCVVRYPASVFTGIEPGSFVGESYSSGGPCGGSPESSRDAGPRVGRHTAHRLTPG